MRRYTQKEDPRRPFGICSAHHKSPPNTSPRTRRYQTPPSTSSSSKAQLEASVLDVVNSQNIPQIWVSGRANYARRHIASLNTRPNMYTSHESQMYIMYILAGYMGQRHLRCRSGYGGRGSLCRAELWHEISI